MASLRSIVDELRSRGSEKTRITYVRHGMPADRVFGVSVADLKAIAKTIKGQQVLACELYATGIMDAMYLAGMVADGAEMTRKQLQSWADGAVSMSMISEHTVPWVTVENADAFELAKKWTRSKKEHVASAGWCTYSGLVATRADAALDLKEIEGLLRLVVAEIGGAKGRASTR
jgi:3-methyladenine DNA glycosylase AlkD